MPNYNSFNAYPTYSAYPANNYTQNGYMQQPMQSYQQPQTQMQGICWVDGEIGAKAQALPVGWPANAPFPMWDTNDQIIYLKSTNQMGMPNPLQKLHYTIEDMPKQPLMQHSRAALPGGEQQRIEAAPDMSEYVRRDELEQMKEELKTVITSANADREARKDGKPAV